MEGQIESAFIHGLVAGVAFGVLIGGAIVAATLKWLDSHPSRSRS